MSDKDSTLAALGRFLDKIESLIYIIVQKNHNTNFPAYVGREIVWKRVLDSVYAKRKATHSIEDSYRTSCSAMTEALVEGGGKTDYETLIKFCLAEHDGRFITKRNGRLACRPAPVPYEGEIEAVEQPQTVDDDELRVREHVSGMVEAVFALMKARDADILRRRYMDNRCPKLKQLARDYKMTLPAVKMRLMRAEQQFTKHYRETYPDADGIPPHDCDDAATQSANLLETAC